MKILITEEQFNNLIPSSVKRRMTSKDFQILDDIIRNNKRYFIAQDFDRYLEGNLSDSLNEFIKRYKVEEINQNFDYDDFEREEYFIYDIFKELIPFLKKKYHDVLYDYHMEYRRQNRNINESEHTLLRRLDSFRDILEESLELNDPCEYSRYEQYKRVVINVAIGIILNREKIESPFKTTKQIDNFRDNVLYPLFEDRIKEHYNLFDGKC